MVSTFQLCCLSECQDSRHQPQWRLGAYRTGTGLAWAILSFPSILPSFCTFWEGGQGAMLVMEYGLHKLRPAKPGIHHANVKPSQFCHQLTLVTLFSFLCIAQTTSLHFPFPSLYSQLSYCFPSYTHSLTHSHTSIPTHCAFAPYDANLYNCTLSSLPFGAP